MLLNKKKRAHKVQRILIIPDEGKNPKKTCQFKYLVEIYEQHMTKGKQKVIFTYICI